MELGFRSAVTTLRGVTRGLGNAGRLCRAGPWKRPSEGKRHQKMRGRCRKQRQVGTSGPVRRGSAGDGWVPLKDGHGPPSFTAGQTADGSVVLPDQKAPTEPGDVLVKCMNLKGPAVHAGQGRGGFEWCPQHTWVRTHRRFSGENTAE